MRSSGGAAPPVCGFMAFLAMYSDMIRLRLFSSCIILALLGRSGATSPLRMMTLATSVASIVPKTCLILSSGARVPFLAFLKIVSMTMWSYEVDLLAVLHGLLDDGLGSMSTSKLSPCDSNLATIASSKSTIGPTLHVRQPSST